MGATSLGDKVATDQHQRREDEEQAGRSSSGRHPESETQSGPLTELRCLFAELVGTFALTFVAAGGTVMQEVSKNEVTFEARVAAPGLLVLAMIYSLGDVSGMHINPAVTLAFAVRGAFSWRKVPGYVIAQLAGAILAALVLLSLFGDVKHLGATLPHQGTTVSLITEIILTTLLVTVIIGTATGHKVVGPNAGIAVGATIALCGLIADPISGASMNPARSAGPAIVNGDLGNLWIYVVGPVVGAMLAVLINLIVHGTTKPHEKEAATGEETERREGKKQNE